MIDNVVWLCRCWGNLRPLSTLWCTFGWLERERCGSFDRRVLNKNTWQGKLGSWFFQPDGRIIRLTSLPVESLFDHSVYIMQHSQSVDQQRSVHHEFQFSYDANLPQIQILFNYRKFKSWHTKFPWRGAWIYNPKIGASCMEIHIQTTHESLFSIATKKGKTEAGNHDSSDLLRCKKHRLRTIEPSLTSEIS